MITTQSKEYVDLSHKLDVETQTYPNEHGFSQKPISLTEEHGCTVHSMTMTSHTGTHIDAPFHFFTDGRTIDNIPLASLIGPAYVVDLTQREPPLQPRQCITWADLEPQASRIHGGVILLINTGWSKRFWKKPEYYAHPYFSRDAAEAIWDRGVRVVGFDTLNPDETPYRGVGGTDGWGFHDVVLGRGGVIAENLTNLEAITGKDNVVVHLLPLNITGGDGSPVRAIATIG